MKTFSCLLACLLLLLLGISSAPGQESIGDFPKIVKKVLFIGDSITLNPPVESLGWKGNWGMAASELEKDYVHLFYHKLCALQPDSKPELFISGRDVAAAGRIDQNLKHLDGLRAINADLIVIQLGENEREADMKNFEEFYERLVSGVKGDQSPIILCTGVWSPKATSVPTTAEDPNSKDAIIRRVCERQGANFVRIVPVPVGADAGSEKRFSNWGVNWHPGDKGMQHYADSLWKVVTPLLGGQGKPSASLTPAQSVIATDDFEYDTIDQLKTVWKIGGSGFSGPIKTQLNTIDSKEGAKCLELIVPPTNTKEKGRIVLDVTLEGDMAEMKEARFSILMEKTATVFLAGQYFADKDWKNHFSRLVEIQPRGDWQKVVVLRDELSTKSGTPSWSDVEQMRFSMWIPPESGETKILIDQMVWDREEEPLPLNTAWYN